MNIAVMNSSYNLNEFFWPSVTEANSLAIFGNFEHFLGSMLSKTMAKFGIQLIDGFKLYERNPNDFSNSLMHSTLLKWDPLDPYAINVDIRNALVGKKIINDTHFNNSKKNVHFHFMRTFGYPLAVNPRIYSGKIVVKSNQNAMHDGVVISGPIDLEDQNKTYSVLVDNTTADGKYVWDIRVPIVGGVIPFVYVKYRTIEMRFETDSSYARLFEPLKILHKREIVEIRNFCNSIGLEYGELDILRDRSSGKIYVVDVNNTPYGPPNRLEEFQIEIAHERIYSTFLEFF